MSENYKIGQVLYVVSEAQQQVIPVQVYEIHKKETIDGEEIVFMVQDPKETGPYDLEDIEGEVFMDHSEVSKFLKKQANAAIDEMVEFAVEVAKKRFNVNETVFKSSTIPTGRKRGRPKKEKKEPSDKQPQQRPQKIEEDVEEEDGVIETQDIKGNVQKLRVGKIHYPDFKEPPQPKEG